MRLCILIICFLLNTAALPVWADFGDVTANDDNATVIMDPGILEPTQNLSAPIPSLTEWGIGTIVVLLAGVVLFTKRRRSAPGRGKRKGGPLLPFA